MHLLTFSHTPETANEQDIIYSWLANRFLTHNNKASFASFYSSHRRRRKRKLRSHHNNATKIASLKANLLNCFLGILTSLLNQSFTLTALNSASRMWVPVFRPNQGMDKTTQWRPPFSTIHKQPNQPTKARERERARWSRSQSQPKARASSVSPIIDKLPKFSEESEKDPRNLFFFTL